MRLLKYLCLFLSAVYLAAALTGIQAASGTSSGIHISHLDAFEWIGALGAALVLAAFAYGIHTKARVAWKAGFAFLTLGYIYSVVAAVRATYHVTLTPSFSTFWLPAGLVAFGGGAITVYWASWWKRHRSYFQ